MAEEIEVRDGCALSSLRRRYELMATNSKTRLFLRILVINFCVLGLIIQTLQLFNQYMSGETVVNTNVETNNYKTIPGITLCFPGLYSMKSISERYNLSESYQDYLKIVSNATEDNYQNQTFNKLLNDIYSQIFVKSLTNSEPNINEIFEMSLPFDFKSDSYPYYPIKVEVNGDRLHSNGTLENNKWFRDETPVQSFVLRFIDIPKVCFTYFTHLNTNWTEYQLNIKEITIHTYPLYQHIPKGIVRENGLKLSMHSPNTIPRVLTSNDFIDIEIGHKIEMTYNRWKSTQLNTILNRNCMDYNSDDKQYSLRSDCLNHCIQQKLNKCSNQRTYYMTNNGLHEECLFPTNSLWNNQTFPMGRHLKKCLIDHGDIYKQFIIDRKVTCLMSEAIYESECQYKCQSDCVNRYYNFDVKTIKPFFEGNTLIKIRHNQMPDQFTQHLPPIPLISLIANFGGLLSLWLGLSLMTALHFLLNMF